ncbi:pantoate--beta-alanine ligase [Alkaliphilus transvaalensis]|nr:pantoate--beta-alanine ligase [Alkaliphilus transvaalensis]
MIKVITTIEEMKKIIKDEKAQGKSIGFVPTMGYLHDGHISLVKRAKAENDVVVVSIFVNPTQFGVNEDYDVYPRDLEGDKARSEEGGAQYIFHPTVEEMYPYGYQTFVEVFGITDKLCGASRPGHFRGVTTVVNKLFQIVSPHKAYFGLKDAQQVAVIEKMVRDLNIEIEVVPCPIVRESDGLAMSSRNVNLSETDRQSALVLSKSLFKAKEAIEAGIQDAKAIYLIIEKNISEEVSVHIDYIKIVDFDTLEDVTVIEGRVLIALAAKVGKVRLIDNIIMEA